MERRSNALRHWAFSVAPVKVLFLLLLALNSLSAAGSRYTEFRYGAFEIFTDVGEDEARALLNELEQLRNAVGTLIGKQDPEALWPIRILHTRKGSPLLKPALGRDAYMASLHTITPEFRAALVRLLLDDAARRMPDTWELGLISLLSTLQVDRTRVTIGAPPSVKTRDWSRVHMLTIDPQYSGKLRVLLTGIQQGLDSGAAYRNAFEQKPEQVERNLNAYIEAGKYEAVPFASRTLDPKRQFYAREVDAAKAALLEGDFQLALGNTQAAATLYKTAGNDEAVGIATKDAKLLASASTARGLVEKARLASTPTEKRIALLLAAELHKRWAEPHILLAGLETDTARKVPHLKKAAELQPRSAQAWETLALAQEQAGLLVDAPKSWIYAERASQDSSEVTRIRAARARAQELRVEQQLAEKAEARRKTEQELNDLRNRALADIRAAEARANAGKQALDPNTPIDWYKEDKPPTRVTGSLLRVDCIGKRAKLALRTPDEQLLSLLVVNPAKVILSGGDTSLSCGIQKPARTVVVLHNEKPDKKLGTLGEVLSVEFR